MERTYHAVVLKRKDTGETDRRLTLLTQESGVIEVIAKGARKAASRLAGISEPLAASIVHVAMGKKNAFVTQAQPVASFLGLRSDYERLSFGLALAELASAVLPHEQPAAEAFTLVVSSLQYLEKHSTPLIALIWAEVQLLSLSGFMPELSGCVVTGVPVQEAMALLSPHAGGYVAAESAGSFTDRFAARAEVLYNLVALAGLDRPPKHLKFATESLIALFPFWKAIAERSLPANEEVVRELVQ